MRPRSDPVSSTEQPPQKYILAHRVDLHAQLREIATIETGVGTAVNLVTATGVTDVDIESNTITFKDESKRQADLIVGADGVHVSEDIAFVGFIS